MRDAKGCCLSFSRAWGVSGPCVRAVCMQANTSRTVVNFFALNISCCLFILSFTCFRFVLEVIVLSCLLSFQSFISCSNPRSRVQGLSLRLQLFSFYFHIQPGLLRIVPNPRRSCFCFRQKLLLRDSGERTGSYLTMHQDSLNQESLLITQFKCVWKKLFAFLFLLIPSDSLFSHEQRDRQLFMLRESVERNKLIVERFGIMQNLFSNLANQSILIKFDSDVDSDSWGMSNFQISWIHSLCLHEDEQIYTKKVSVQFHFCILLCKRVSHACLTETYSQALLPFFTVHWEFPTFLPSTQSSKSNFETISCDKPKWIHSRFRFERRVRSCSSVYL